MTAERASSVWAQGFMVPIDTKGGRFRVNVILNSNAKLPDPIWQRPDFQSAAKIVGGTFPVRFWRLQQDQPATLVHTEFVAARQIGFAQVNGVQRWVADGEVLAIEFTPALLSYYREDLGYVTGPLVSFVDNWSGDPVTVYPVLGEFERGQ